MAPKSELTKKSVAELRKLASTVGVKNYGKLDKVALIHALLESEKVETPVYTDKNEAVIEPQMRVNVMIKGKEFKGIITELKIIDKDQMAYVLLDGRDKAQLIHTGDIEKDPHAKKGAHTIEKKGGVTTVINKEVNGSTEEEGTASPETETAPVTKKEKVKKEKPIKEKKEKTLQDVPKPGSKSEEMVKLLKAGHTRAEVAAKVGAIYQFVCTVEKRYCPEVAEERAQAKAAIAATEKTPVEEPKAEKKEKAPKKDTKKTAAPKKSA